MTPIAFVGGGFENRNPPSAHPRLVNMYVEVNGKDERLRSTPGLTLRNTLGGEIRGATTLGERVFYVAGNALYEVTTTTVAIGTIRSSAGRVGIAASDTQILIVDGVAGYVFDGTALSTIADVDFPNGVKWAAWEGEFFIVAVFDDTAPKSDRKQFFISSLNDGATWDGLDFASAVNKPETIRAITVARDRLLLFTTTGVETWENTGNSEFAFERNNGSSVELGDDAPYSVVVMNGGGVYWLGRDKDGGRIIVSYQGGQPTRISTHAIEHLLGSVDVSDAYALAYQQEGHTFYCLTVPALDMTFAFDAATQKWAQRMSGNGRWCVTHHVFTGQHLVGANGNVYLLDESNPREDGVTIKRVRSTDVTSNNGELIPFSAFRLDCETGTSDFEPLVMMRYSNDGGFSWSDERTESLGKPGEYGRNVTFWRCGMGRRRVWETTVTDAVELVIKGAAVA